MNRDRRRWLGGLALGMAVACGPQSPAADQPRTPRVSAAPTASEAEATPMALPAPEVPTIPDAEDAQHDHLATIEVDCDVLGPYHQNPPDVGSAHCLEQLKDCVPRMHGLGLLAQSRHAAVKGKALALAARMHNIHRCGDASPVHPCSADRATNELGESALCAHLGWVPPALARALSHEELAVRKGAAEGLVNTVVPAEVLVPAVRDLLRRYEPGPGEEELTSLVSVVLMALRMSPQGVNALGPELRTLLTQRQVHDERVVVDALVVVQTLGEAAEEALQQEVVAALGDRRSRVRLAAVEALGRIGDMSDAPKLVPLLNDRDATVREVARATRRRLTLPFGRLGHPRF